MLRLCPDIWKIKSHVKEDEMLYLCSSERLLYILYNVTSYGVECRLKLVLLSLHSMGFSY